MKANSMIDQRGILTPEGMKQLKENGSSVSCECPGHLIEILDRVKEFTAYQEQCINENVQDEITHQWLKSTSINLEHLLTSTIMSLSRIEGIINEDNDIIG